MTAFYKKPLYLLRHALMGKLMLKPQPKPLMFSGEGSALRLCSTIAQFGIGKLLIVTDKPLRDLGIMDSAVAALNAAGVQTEIFDGVLPMRSTSALSCSMISRT